MAQLQFRRVAAALIIMCVTHVVAQQQPTVDCPNISTVGCDFLTNPMSTTDPTCSEPPTEMLSELQQGSGCARVDLYSFTITDCNGLSATCQFNVNRNQGNLPPRVDVGVDPRVPLVGTLPCGTETGSTFLGVPRFRDDCDGTIQGQEDNAQTNDGCVTTIMRTFTGRDSCGAVSTVQQMIMVDTDADNPTATPPPNTQFIGELGALPGPDVLGDVQCDDACSDPTSSWSDLIVSAAPNPLVVRRTFTCVDACGNEATAFQDITVQPVQVPTAPTAISGDPHFRGFLGQTYDFHGTPDAVFNLITSQDVQVNSLFLDSDLIKRNTLKTYMGSISIEHADAKILVACNREEAEWYIRLNGEDVKPGKHLKFGNATFKLTHADNARSVFATPALQLSIRFSASTYSSCHLNLRAKLFAKPPVPFHGVLGQTASPETQGLVGHGDQGAGVVEGAWEDYEIASKDLFGKDFKYNLYTGESVDYDNMEPLKELDPAWGD